VDEVYGKSVVGSAESTKKNWIINNEVLEWAKKENGKLAKPRREAKRKKSETR